MCVNIEVTMPFVNTFLYKFSLRVGCHVVLIYTSLRAFFYLFVAMAAMLEILVHQHNMFGTVLINTPPPTVDQATIYTLFFCYQPMIIAEIFLLIYLLHLWTGLTNVSKQKVHHLEYYLLCRVIVWMVEAICLLVLSFKHQLLIGWYLMMLIFIMLDLYFFVVVYSYYVSTLMNEDPKKSTTSCNNNCCPE